MICVQENLPPEIVKSDWDKAMAICTGIQEMFGKDFVEITNDDTVQALDAKANQLFSKMMTWTSKYPKNKLALKWKERMLLQKKGINTIMLQRNSTRLKRVPHRRR